MAGHSLSTPGARFTLPLPLVIGGLQEQHQDTGHGGGGWGGGGQGSGRTTSSGTPVPLSCPQHIWWLVLRKIVAESLLMAAQKRSGGAVSQLGPGGTAEEALGPWVGPPDGLEAGRGVAAQGRPEAWCLVAGSGGGGGFAFHPGPVRAYARHR